MGRRALAAAVGVIGVAQILVGLFFWSVEPTAVSSSIGDEFPDRGIRAQVVTATREVLTRHANVQFAIDVASGLLLVALSGLLVVLLTRDSRPNK